MRVSTALMLLRPNVEWSMPNGSTDVNDIIWHTENVVPVTQAELDAKLTEPEPVIELTPEQKLEKAGLSVDELKQLLGL